MWRGEERLVALEKATRSRPQQFSGVKSGRTDRRGPQTPITNLSAKKSRQEAAVGVFRSKVDPQHPWNSMAAVPCATIDVRIDSRRRYAVRICARR